MIEVRNLVKKYGSHLAVDHLNFTVEQGQIYGFLGPNGSGKTTTIKMILRLIDMDNGSITVNGFDTKKQFEKAMECIGAIVENPDMYTYMTGRDNLKLHARIRNVDSKRIDEVLELVELKDRADEKVKKYSLGMKQRLGLAITLLHKPKVLILDEPTNGLDPAGIKKLRDILKEIAHKDNVAVFVSSHILAEMQLMCDKVAVIDNAKIVKIEEITKTSEEKIEKVEIRVENKEKAVQILKEKFDIEIQNKTIEIEISLEKIPTVVKELALGDAGIKAVIPKEHSLEEIFFDATKGGKK